MYYILLCIRVQCTRDVRQYKLLLKHNSGKPTRCPMVCNDFLIPIIIWSVRIVTQTVFNRYTPFIL